MGPDTETAATTLPRESFTGADTLATPGSRSPALWAQPRRRTSTSVRSVNFAVGSTVCWVAESLCASSTLAPEPAVMGSREPTGTVSRSPAGGSRATMQMRSVPSRRYSCTLSPVISRSRGRTTAHAASNGSLTWPASSVTAGPSRHLPSASRASSRCVSSPAASRWAVARGSPVRSQSSASPHGDSATV
jgi:hypothetical protein